jgi:micrococcal nuclease
MTVKSPTQSPTRCSRAVLTFALSVALAGCFNQTPQEIRVIDGDTLKIDGETVRLYGVDTPETRRPRCVGEVKIGRQATALVVDRLAPREGQPPVVKIWRKGKDRFGRTLATVRIDGEDLGETLLEAGLAEPTPSGKRHDWCKRFRLNK